MRAGGPGEKIEGVCSKNKIEDSLLCHLACVGRKGAKLLLGLRGAIDGFRRSLLLSLYDSGMQRGLLLIAIFITTVVSAALNDFARA